MRVPVSPSSWLRPLLVFLAAVATAAAQHNDTNATLPGTAETSTEAPATTLLQKMDPTLAGDPESTPSSHHADTSGSTPSTGSPETTSPANTTQNTAAATVVAETTPRQTTATRAETTTPVTDTEPSRTNTVTTPLLPTTGEKVNETPPQHPATTLPVTSTAPTAPVAEQTSPATFIPRKNATTPKRRIGGNVMKSTPSTRRLVLVLRGNCSRENLMGDLEHAFRKLSPVENVSVTEIHCSTLLDVNVTLSAGELQLKQLLRNLSLSRNLPVGDEASAAHRFVLTDFSVREDVANDGATSVRPRWVPTEEELIIYIAVGVLFAIVLIIAFVVCTIKCCRRQPTKTLDFLETPHLNLRLEDYTLTRIPRPHTIYADHLRTPTSENGPTPHFGGPGLVQPFDTCIVPLEDAPPRDQSRRNKEDRQSASQQLKTFGQAQVSPSPSRTPGPRPRRVDDIDDDSESRRSKSLSSSRERLACQRKVGPYGVDNPIYVSDSVYGRKAKG